MTKWLNEGLIFGIVVIVNIVSLSSRPIQGFSSSSIVSLLQLDTLSACELAIFSACLSVSRDGRCKKQVGADLQQRWPWQKSDDLWRAAISIIMKKLISWCAGLRVRLREMVGGTVADFNSRVAGGGVMAGRKKRREKRVGGSGWCGIGGGKCMISLAALWCCSPCCHTSKREQIKGSSFDEYKTESPAEKHSPSLPF